MKKIGIVTGTRAEYGLLYPLLKQIDDSKEIDGKLIVTGTHLSELHGETIEQIKKDGVPIHYVIDTEIQGDEETHICNTIANGLNKFSRLFSCNEFDAILVLGDRYELWSVCIGAVIHKIPIIHVHGGEITQGLIDDPIRHSVTKMASVHFPTMDLYGKRIIQMGEDPRNVYVVGALGIDNINNMKFLDMDELYEFTGINFKKDVALMTYHPVTLDNIEQAELQIKEVLSALLQTDLLILITMPNADTGGNRIYETIKQYVDKYPDKFQLRKSLGQKGYLSAMKYTKLMIGNSSSGIIESASFKIPVINIGDRQAGRYKPRNIINCGCKKEIISKSIKKALSNEFVSSISELENAYGDGHTAARIVNILETINFEDKSKLLKKGFNDIKF